MQPSILFKKIAFFHKNMVLFKSIPIFSKCKCLQAVDFKKIAINWALFLFFCCEKTNEEYNKNCPRQDGMST